MNASQLLVPSCFLALRFAAITSVATPYGEDGDGRTAAQQSISLLRFGLGTLVLTFFWLLSPCTGEEVRFLCLL